MPTELVTGYRPGDLLIAEIMPAPGELFDGEWVELHNPGPEPISLAGWRIDDSADGGAHLIPEDQLIAGGATLRVQLGRAILNNGGDTVRLLAPDGLLIDSFAYKEAVTDQPFSRDPLNQPPALSASETALPDAPIPAPEATSELLAVPQAETPQPALRPASLMAEALTAQPAYMAASPGEAYSYQTATPRPAGPAPGPVPAEPTPRASDAGLASLALPGGLGLIVIALALFVTERTPARAEEDDQGVL